MKRNKNAPRHERTRGKTKNILQADYIIYLPESQGVKMSTEIFKGQAIEKLDTKDKFSGKEAVMAPSIRKALIEFCGQSEEFAQAVVQGKSFKECMAHVAKGAGQALSDLDAYKKAVQFFFPTATISFSMTINTEGNNSLAASKEKADPAKAESAALSMSLDDLLGL